MNILRLFTLALLSAGAASAVTIGFDTDADFDNNFVKLTASGTSTISTFAFASPSTERAVRKTGTGTQSVLYDTSATGGSAGSGGTAGTGADTFGDLTVSADMRVSAFNTPSLGLWSRVNPAATSGYLGLVNIISATSVQLRVLDSNSIPSGATVGTVLFNQTFTLTGITLDTSTFYTASFTTTTTAQNNVTFTLTLETLGGQSIVSTGLVTDTTSPVLTAGQAGFRAASSTLYVDNFSVAAIPEPSASAAFLGLAAMSTVFLRRRTR